jgi:hypothetical protein
MKVAPQKDPGVDLQTAFLSEKAQSGKEIVAILIGQEDRPFLDPSADNMVENTRSV